MALDTPKLIHMLRTMMLIREFDERAIRSAAGRFSRPRAR